MGPFSLIINFGTNILKFSFNESQTISGLIWRI